MRALAPLCGLFLAAPLLPQTVDIVGGTTSTPTLANTSKANLFRVDSTILLLQFEIYLDVPGPDTLTFFAYRHPQRNGNATLEWTLPVNVAGGGGPQWYSTGPIAQPMVCGNYYLLGVAWSGSVRYHYTTGTSGAVSFGNWIRARTPGNPPPPTISITGSDAAQYYQRLTSLAMPTVGCVGTGCTTTQPMAPRLVASAVPARGTQMSLVVTNGAPSVGSICAFTFGPTLPVPLPMLGCSVWLDIGRPVFNMLIFLDGTGLGSLPLTVPPDPGLAGVQLASQAAVLGPSLDLTGAVDLTVM